MLYAVNMLFSLICMYVCTLEIQRLEDVAHCTGVYNNIHQHRFEDLKQRHKIMGLISGG